MPEKVILKNVVEGKFTTFKNLPVGKLFRLVGEENTKSIYLKLSTTIRDGDYSYNCMTIDGTLGYLNYQRKVQQLEVE